MMKHFFIMMLLVIISGCAGAPAKKSNPSPTQAFSLELETIDGEMFSSKDLTGKKHLFISFWATYCDPCMAELIKLKELYPQYKDEIEIVAVAIDPAEMMENVRSFAIENSLPFPVLVDPSGSEVSSIIPGGDTVPYAILIDKNGTIISTHTGYEPGDEKKLAEEFDTLINKESVHE